MQLLINLNQEQYQALGPVLEDLDLVFAPRLISINHDNPFKKQATYQVSTDDDLQSMVTEFNEQLDRAGIDERLKEPTGLDADLRWRLLDWLNANATWSEHGEFLETWFEDDAPLMQEELNKRPELLQQT